MATLLAVITFAALWAWTLAHQVAIAWVFAVLIERLPPPDQASGKVYTYVYGVLQFVAANTRRSQDAVATRRQP